MAVKFSVPAQAAKSALVVDTFLGVDYTNSPGNVANSMSPNAPNMIRDVPGKVRKSMGYELVAQFEGRINGYHRRTGDEQGIVHAGTTLLRMDGTVLYEGASDAPSQSWQLNDVLAIADGKALLIYDGETVKPASEAAKIPLLTIAKEPEGGGTDYEALNLLQPKFSERFAGTSTAKEFHLSFSGLDEEVTVKTLTADGEWVEMTGGYTVNTETGVVTFSTAPGASPITGEDNVEITASRTVEDYADRVNKCRFGILFGVNGAADRLFLSGNPDYPNQDWYSGQYDPTYWPDTGYSQLGTKASAIVGYSIVGNYLAAHKDEHEPDRNVVIRRGDLVESTPAFPITNSLQGPGAVASRSFAYLSTEPVFLTRLGVYAVTPSDISGERYAQNRSYFINGLLLKQPGLEDAVAVVHKDLYWLCVNGQAFILDGLQNVGRTSGEPYSTRQYACFHRTNLPAVSLWVEDERLYFGTADGRVCRFFDDPEALGSYNDLGEAIPACWETPDLSGKRFYANKTFRYLAVSLSSAIATSVQLSALKNGVWKAVRSQAFRAQYFSFSGLSFSKLAFTGDQTAKTRACKTKVKRVDKARYRFENSELNEPFGLMAWAVEFTENGYFKR